MAGMSPKSLMRKAKMPGDSQTQAILMAVDESHWFTLALSVACAFVFTVRRLRTLNKHSSMAAQPNQAQNATVAGALARLESLQRGTEERMGNNIALGGATTSLALASAGSVAAHRIQIVQTLDALEGGGAGGDGEEPPPKKAKKAKKAEEADQKFEIVMELLVAMMGEVDGVKAWLALRAPACALDSAGITSRLP